MQVGFLKSNRQCRTVNISSWHGKFPVHPCLLLDWKPVECMEKMIIKLNNGVVRAHLPHQNGVVGDRKTFHEKHSPEELILTLQVLRTHLDLSRDIVKPSPWVTERKWNFVGNNERIEWICTWGSRQKKKPFSSAMPQRASEFHARVNVGSENPFCFETAILLIWWNVS